MRAVASVGRLDVLVNNAGFSQVQRVADYPPIDRARRALHETVFMGTMLSTKHAIPLLRVVHAPVVDIASTMGPTGFPGIPGYSAMKGGVIASSRQAAFDYAPDGIRVNSVCPGPTQTARLRGIVDSGAVQESMLIGNVPLGRGPNLRGRRGDRGLGLRRRLVYHRDPPWLSTAARPRTEARSASTPVGPGPCPGGRRRPPTGALDGLGRASRRRGRRP